MKAAKLFFILLCLAALIAPAAAAGGSGTEANPYIIETAAELQSIQNNLGAYYRLANDIDLSGISWSPIGSYSAGFYGSLDGNGKIIKNLVVSGSSDFQGLFGGITSGSVIKDITLQDCSIITQYGRSAVLVGGIAMSTTAHETATLSNVNIIRCSIRGAYSGIGNDIGCLVGLIGTSADVEIIDCTISNSVSESISDHTAGGIVGQCGLGSSTKILRCTVLDSHIQAATSMVGGLVGKCRESSSLIIDSSTIQNSIVESSNNNVLVGGLVGRCYSGGSVNTVNCNVLNCIIKGKDFVGGLFGDTIQSGSAVSAVMCNVIDCTIVASDTYAGGIIGRVNTETSATFSKCIVKDSSILASSYAAGVCPAYS